jgi:predicted transcriptional regulator
MYTELFSQIGLAKNEGKIYETLLREGESSVGHIATQSKVHRRNVYDSLNRLVEKGLVFEIVQHKENRYQAVDPHKLSEILEEKQVALAKVMPELESLHNGSPSLQEVYIYRGKEGWKNYIREILRIGKDVHGIGAKAPLNRANFPGMFDQLMNELANNKITSYNLYDHEVRGTEYEGHLHNPYRFLPPEYSSTSSVIILADRIFMFSGITLGNYNEDYSITVIVNKELAEAQRKWFAFMWSQCGTVNSKP